MRREAKRSLEGPAEIVRTEARQPPRRRKQYRLGEMLFDVGRDGALLPGREAALRKRLIDDRHGFDLRHSLVRDDARLFRREVASWIALVSGRPCLGLAAGFAAGSLSATAAKRFHQVRGGTGMSASCNFCTSTGIAGLASPSRHWAMATAVALPTSERPYLKPSVY